MWIEGEPDTRATSMPFSSYCADFELGFLTRNRSIVYILWNQIVDSIFTLFIIDENVKYFCSEPSIKFGSINLIFVSMHSII